MKFTSAEKVQSTINAGDENARIRGENRERIYSLFNGEPMVSEADAQKMGLRVNVNWGEAAVIGQHGRRQYTNAFNSGRPFFKVKVNDAPEEHEASWSGKITKFLNRIMLNSEQYLELHDNQWAGVLVEGHGVKLWETKERWRPDYVAIEDFRVPTDTRCDLSNLVWFGVRKPYTEAELTKKIYGKYRDPGWNKSLIIPILEKYHDKTFEDVNYTWSTAPEKMAELVKQNGGFYASDAVPTIPLWHFYFLGDDDRWYCRVVADQNTQGAVQGQKEFLYTSDKPFANELSNLIHVQYGDLNTKTPFLYHSVRSLGFLLMEPCFFSNLTRCRSVQHLHEMMNIWLRSTDPAGKARAKKVELFDRCFIPDGISIVPQAERHQVDQAYAQWVTAELEGLMKEASVSYTQDTEGRESDETATGVMARVASVNALMSGLLSKAFRKEKFAYIEMCRRFCLRDSRDADARRFQEYCRLQGIPKLFVNVDMWDVEPEVPMGSGNPTMEQAITQQLLGIRPLFDGPAQQEILHEATVAITGDPSKADRWAPVGKMGGITDAQEHAQLAFSTLMQGVPIPYKRGLNPIDQIETLLYLTAGVVTRIDNTGGLTTDQELSGLQTVIGTPQDQTLSINGLIAQLAQDRGQKDKVKQYSDALSQLTNEIKGIAQRSQEAKQAAMQNGNGQDGKIQAALINAQAKSKISEAKAAQNMQHKELSFHQEQQRKNIETAAEIERQNLAHGVDLMNSREKAKQKPEAGGG